MNSICTSDGTEIYYKDWGKGQPVVFSHDWPLSGDAFEDQMFFLASRGYRCIAQQTEDLKKIDVPTLILHGDDDQIVPIGASAMKSSKLVKKAPLKIYKDGAHGMCTTQKDEVNKDLLEFIKS